MTKSPRDYGSGGLKTSREGDFFAQAFNEVFQETVIVFAMGLYHVVKSLSTKRAFIVVPMLLSWFAICHWLAIEGLHLGWLHSSDSQLFNLARIKWLWSLGYWWNFGILMSLGLMPFVLSIGWLARSVRTRYQKLFFKIKLTNGLGDTPKLVSIKRLGNGRTRHLFDANGVSLSDFRSRLEQIESHLRRDIESIDHGDRKGLIAVVTTKHSFPDKVQYTELERLHPLPKESFYLGRSLEGIHCQSIAELPHLLISGTTGSGKSVYFKQALLGLLESSPHLQMYLIDLKGGLEMIDFKTAPNVRVIKTMAEAVQCLRAVRKEMQERFDYLERRNRKAIRPREDRKDRVVVAVDEASVLYMNRPPMDPDRDLALEARNLADSISKLSRAAAIHLMLATQKLDKSVIPTTVSENISGRMAFRANSMQGSLMVLGSKDAMELPEIPGRGIWNFGTRTKVVQAPLISETQIRERCTKIAELFQNGERELLSPMLGARFKAKTKKQAAQAYQLENFEPMSSKEAIHENPS